MSGVRYEANMNLKAQKAMMVDCLEEAGFRVLKNNETRWF